MTKDEKRNFSKKVDIIFEVIDSIRKNHTEEEAKKLLDEIEKIFSLNEKDKELLHFMRQVENID